MRIHDIEFMNAYLIMNPHRHGLPYGIPLDDLEHSVILDQEIVFGSESDRFWALCVPQNEILYSTTEIRPRKEEDWAFAIRSIPKILGD